MRNDGLLRENGVYPKVDTGKTVLKRKTAQLFVSVDPLQFKYPELTPFQYASNRPITGIDLDGLEFVNAHEAKMNEAQAEVNEAQSKYDNMIENHEGGLTKSDIKGYKSTSGLNDAQGKLKKQTKQYKDVDSYLNTLELTNKDLYDEFNTLTDAEGQSMSIKIELIDKSDDSRLATVKGLSFGTKTDTKTGEVLSHFATATDGTLTIQLFNESTDSGDNTFPGDKTGQNYRSFTNELGDIKFFFDNVKDQTSFQYFQDTTDPTMPGYTDSDGAGQKSFYFEEERAAEVENYMKNNPSLMKKYDPVKRAIKR
mgnify:CR=1 FL=1